MLFAPLSDAGGPQDSPLCSPLPGIALLSVGQPRGSAQGPLEPFPGSVGTDLHSLPRALCHQAPPHTSLCPFQCPLSGQCHVTPTGTQSEGRGTVSGVELVEEAFRVERVSGFGEPAFDRGLSPEPFPQWEKRFP